MSKTDIQKFDIHCKKVGVIGCGGLGSNIIAHLAGAGIGELVLCDYDTVSESNLNRQFLYNSEDLEKSKCESAKKWIKKYSPETKVTSINKKISSSADANAFDDCDLLILAVDNAVPRKIMNAYCANLGKPLIYGGIDGFYGMAYLYVPGKSSCLECAGLTGSSDIHSSISASAGVIGSLEASLAIKYLIGNAQSSIGKLLVYDNDSISKLPISSQADCPICNKSLQ